ncbi:MAG: hydrogenase [Chloroflexi bacterium]|nr:hydrogenase [Chloroflexota bacterium]
MPVASPVATQLLQLLGFFLLLTAFAMIASRHLDQYIRAYAVQSIALAFIAMVIGYFTGRVELYAVAFFTILFKAVMIPSILLGLTRQLRVHLRREERPYVNLPTALLIGVVLVFVAFFTSPSVVAPGTFLDEPPIAVSVALVLIGLFLLSARRRAVAQVVGLLTIENGLFSGAIAIAYGMPLIVEFGILFDILVAVLVMSVLVTLIQQEGLTVDTADLRELRG